MGALACALLYPLAIARPAAAAEASKYRSVVVLGDSVASGEGTLDGYRYAGRALLPTWNAATAPRAYDSKYPDCHVSPRAYGRIVARALGATETNLACSGASIMNGIVNAPTLGTRSLGPAQFGNWSTRQNLNAQYDAAEPDLVVVSAGANSVGFERALAYCVLASRGFTDAESARIAGTTSVVDALAYAVSTVLQRRTVTAPVCTARNPGAYLQQNVIDQLPRLQADAENLATVIRARGRDAGNVPEVVFTTYANPLPNAAASVVACPDAAALGSAQLAFMNQLFDQANAALRAAVTAVPGVRVADPDPDFAGHRWCDPDPWIYGTSILVSNPTSWAPFHPTPAGQRAIAERVLATLDQSPSGNGPV